MVPVLLLAPAAAAYQAPSLQAVRNAGQLSGILQKVFHFPPGERDPAKAIAGAKGEVYQAFRGAQCGGWNLNLRVEENTGIGRRGLIATVEGAPGRGSDTMGNRESGMAKREESFRFPAGGADGVEGYATACRPNQPEFVMKETAVGPRLVRYPDFPDTEPPCLWRWARDGKGKIVRFRQGGNAGGPFDRQACKDFCSAPRGSLNDASLWTYPACDGKVVNGKCNGKIELRWICSDAPVTSEYKNCRDCAGSECRCPAADPKANTCARSTGGARNEYRSFFRQYTNIRTTRGNLSGPGGSAPDVLDRIPSPQPGKIAKPIQAACYGFYREYDPKTTRTETKDRQCVIALPLPEGQRSALAMLRRTQRAIGQFWPSSFNSAAPDPLPPPRSASAGNAGDGLWYPDLGGGMSLLSQPVGDGDLNQALLRPDVAEMRAGAQSAADGGWALRSTLRAVDDTVANETMEFRPLTTWWQRLESDAHRLLTPPVVRLRMPASWVARLDMLAPLRPSMTGALPLDPSSRTQPLEVQIDAGDDLMGVLAEMLRQSVLPIREETMPVVVPLGSPVEFRAIAAQWEEWATNRRTAVPPLPVPREADDVIVRLRQYADQIEGVRKLREGMGRVLAAAERREARVLAEIGGAVAEGGKMYAAYLENVRQRLELQKKWKAIQSDYAFFADVANAPWCRNDRFTTPIYSLLDPWYPGRPSLAGGAPSCAPGGLPLLCVPHGERDMLIDVSMFYGDGAALAIPVLKPTLVQLSIPRPGGWQENIADPRSLVLPQLPPVPTISTGTLESLLPEVVTKPPRPAGQPPRPIFQVPPPADISLVSRQLDSAHRIIRGMVNAYWTFWSSLDLQPPAPKRAPACGRKSALSPLDCCGWGQQTCVHTEMDLMERIQRIVARPGVLAREDLDTLGVSRVPTPNPVSTNASAIPGYPLPPVPKRDATCWPEDHACAVPLPERRLAGTGFLLLSPTEMRDPKRAMESVRGELRRSTIRNDGTPTPLPARSLPYDVPTERLYAPFGVPLPVRLHP